MFSTINPKIYDDVADLAQAFKLATPFPYVVIDNFLDIAAANNLLKDFPAVSAMHLSHHYLFTNKYELSFWADVSSSYTLLHQDLFSQSFIKFIQEICGEPLFVDADFCGELHQGVDGSFLDMHIDFNLHPFINHWEHRLTIIIYLNKNWRPQYGGQLQLQGALDQPVFEISPLFNRCVIMRSDDTTFHGYQQLNLPQGVTRKSILINLYREESPDKVLIRKPTTWAVNQKSVLKSSLARFYNPIAALKHRLFGLTPASDADSIKDIKSRYHNLSK
jgi:2OG-Fe(II) oxygenase superfamily